MISKSCDFIAQLAKAPHHYRRGHWFESCFMTLLFRFTGCIPLAPFISNGKVVRTDRKGGIKYSFTCKDGYKLYGHSVISSINGTYDGAAPSCEHKGW